MNGINIDQVAEELIRRIKVHLINNLGRTADEADSCEFYRAFCYAIREETMINWLATTRSISKQNVRMLYYFSMEYLPGRFFMNNITNLCSLDVVRQVMFKMNRNFRDIFRCEDDPGLGNGGLGRLAS